MRVLIPRSPDATTAILYLPGIDPSEQGEMLERQTAAISTAMYGTTWGFAVGQLLAAEATYTRGLLEDVDGLAEHVAEGGQLPRGQARRDLLDHVGADLCAACVPDHSRAAVDLLYGGSGESFAATAAAWPILARPAHWMTSGDLVTPTGDEFPWVEGFLEGVLASGPSCPAQASPDLQADVSHASFGSLTRAFLPHMSIGSSPAAATAPAILDLLAVLATCPLDIRLDALLSGGALAAQHPTLARAAAMLPRGTAAQLVAIIDAALNPPLCRSLLAEPSAEPVLPGPRLERLLEAAAAERGGTPAELADAACRALGWTPLAEIAWRAGVLSGRLASGVGWRQEEARVALVRQPWGMHGQGTARWLRAHASRPSRLSFASTRFLVALDLLATRARRRDVLAPERDSRLEDRGAWSKVGARHILGAISEDYEFLPSDYTIPFALAGCGIRFGRSLWEGAARITVEEVRGTVPATIFPGELFWEALLNQVGLSGHPLAADEPA